MSTPNSDESVKSSTLPEPELNPLLNPILNKNLGRWAEAYFTSPPEKRDEAILHLLRELQAEPGGSKVEPPLRSIRGTSAPSLTRANSVICRECGFENETEQRFCGDCGALLGTPASRTAQVFSSPDEAEHARTSEPARRPDRGESFRTQPFGSILHLTDPAPLPTGAGSGNIGSKGDAMYILLPREDTPAPLKRSYRALIGIGFAVVIAGLAYLAWRGGQSAPQGSTFPAEAPPTANQPVTAPLPAASSSTPTANPAASSQEAASTPAPAIPARTSDAKQQDAAKALAAPTKTTPSQKDSPAISANGTQELGTALSLLNGTPRDSATASQWLWKAVEKKNTAATVLLAGLYLRGDGVQKNCEQGRILLDAAADKGSKDAAALLRNLQAFGCE